MDPNPHEAHQTLFRLFTKESLLRIERRIAEEKTAKEAQREHDEEHKDEEKKEEDNKPHHDVALEPGKTLPTKYGEFPPELIGKPIEDLDEFYQNKYTFCVVAKDRTLFRFSASKAMFLMSPFSPLRRAAIYVLTHPIFNIFVMITILVNCVFMAINKEIPKSEEVFAAIYTCEGLIKIVARGFILAEFTYLRDMWNWLDFIVVSLAHVSFAVRLGNLAALRTFRVLRALKTIAVVPGLKTIVGALMEAVRRLRDVMILTLFVLSIFALVGLQIYQGALKHKCVREIPPEYVNLTKAEKLEFYEEQTNWKPMPDGINYQVCGNAWDAGKCPVNYTCKPVGPNPDYGYTNFDNFGWAMLCAFRLMTQDYWENLYQLVITASGPWHMLFFIVVIFMGSFYLVNLILAIVAMSYDEQQKQDRADEEEEAAQREDLERRLEEEAEHEMKKSASEYSCDGSDVYIPPAIQPPDEKDKISIKSECGVHDNRRRLSVIDRRGKKASLSLPGSPFQLRRGSRGSQFSWRKAKHHIPRAGDKQPLVLPYLDNLNLPYADDSNAVTPTSDDLLCNSPQTNTHSFLAARRRLSSTTSYASRASHNSHLDSSFKYGGGSRRSSFASHQSRHSYTSHGPDHSFKQKDRSRTEPTHFAWTASVKQRAAHPLLPEVIVDKTKSDDNESSSSGSECETAKGKLFPDNPFICRTPSTGGPMVDMKDVLVLKDLIDHASGKRKSFISDENMTRKEYIKAKCLYIINDYEASPCWQKFAHYVDLFIMDAFIDLFITLCILVNTAFMAIDHYNMNDSLTHMLKIGNYVFTGIFTVEAVLKIIALNPVNYLKDKWNCFDILIVFLSFVELGLQNVKGLSILRAFRLLRVFKLAKSWPTLNLLIGIIGRTLGALGNLTFVLAIIVFIFAVMGMQMFGSNYITKKEEFPDRELPRWNFTDFLHSFMIVFRVLCGEWIQSMWDCMKVAGYMCIPFFLLTMIIGNLVVLNLFLALLLSSFGAESLQQSQDDSEPNKLQEAVDRINRFAVFIKSHVMYCIKVKIRRKGVVDGYDQSITRTDVSSKDIIVDGDLSMRNGRICDHEHEGDTDDNDSQDRKDPSDGEDSQKKESDLPTRPASIISTSSKASRTQSESKLSKSLSSEVGGSKYDVEGGGWSPCTLSLSKDDSQISKPIEIDPNEGPEINEVNVVFVRYPDDCCPSCCNKRSPCCDSWIKTPVGKRWWSFRCYMYKLVEHKYFETFIILMICASSLSLAIEDVYIGLPNRVWLAVTLVVMDKIFTVIFVFEMLIKWSAYGFKKYFTDAWCWLDFIIVAISLVSLGAEGAGMGNIGAFRALRTLRALRPLRAVSRWEGMKVVVNALIQAIPAICNVLLVCLVFWLIFSIMGVQLFGGRFHKCKCPDGEDFVVCNASIVPNRDVCKGMNYTWENSRINFDNVFNAYLALFQVATFKGWMEILQDATDSREATFKGWTVIMNDAIDSREEKEQPVREARVGMYMYFVLFIVFGSFFTLNLFIGVIIDNFNMQKKKIRGSLEMFMTEDQKKYYNAMKKLGSKQPQKPIPKPRLKCQQFFFTLTTNQKFDIGIMAVIMLNMLTMAMEHYEQSYMFETALKYVNQVFIAIFTLEAIMKIIGLRWYYFKQPWNVFDFVVVVLSILGLAMSDAFKDYFVSPTLLRVVRVFRVGRVLRLVKSAKGIRTLLFSLAVSLPALFNIGLLLFLVMFIYAIFGMSFFMNVRHTGGLDAMFNFETFGRSMILLFQISTSAGWDGVLAGITNDVDCNAPNATMKDPGDCGSRPMGIFYLITYLVITFLVVINMYIAVILENFSQATEDVQQGLTQDDFDMYYEIWEKYDEEATQYIPFSVLPDFVDALEEPLRLPAPNYYKLVSLEIPICKDEKVHCVDILDALTKNFLGTTGDAAGDLGDVKKGPERVDYSPIGTTLLRQREIFCAKIIQRAYRKYREKRGPLEKIEKPIGNAAPTDNKNVVVDIEQEPTEKEHESLEKKRDAENVPEIVVKDDKDEPIPHCAGPDESRTVELYPDSGVVA